MSVWTHVAGVVRYDDMRVVVLGGAPRIEWLDWVPEGSEGPLTCHVEVGQADHEGNRPGAYGRSEVGPGYEYMATLSVWGDLRDRGEEALPETLRWIEQLNSPPNGVGVRGLSFVVEVEDGPRLSLAAVQSGPVATLALPGSS